MVDIMELQTRLSELSCRKAACGARLGEAARLARKLQLPLLGLFFAMAPTVAQAQDTPDYFRQNCVNCHTIGGGRLTGPDLKDVTQRRDSEWIIGFLQNPKAVIDGGDAYAAKLLEGSRGVVMPIAPGMTRYRAEQIIKLIAAESKLEKSQFQGVKISNKPFTEQDRVKGRKLFTGVRPLKNGGTACNSCHSMYDLSGLGGGHLGPDLTRVYERLKGRKSLGAWLMAPATATMQPVFKSHPLEAEEIFALSAYFESGAKHSEVETSVNRVAFLLMGLAVAAATVFLFDIIWKGRFYAVRRPLVEAGRKVWRSGDQLGGDERHSASNLAAAGTVGEQASPGDHS